MTFLLSPGLSFVNVHSVLAEFHSVNIAFLGMCEPLCSDSTFKVHGICRWMAGFPHPRSDGIGADVKTQVVEVI